MRVSFSPSLHVSRDVRVGGIRKPILSQLLQNSIQDHSAPELRKRLVNHCFKTAYYEVRLTVVFDPGGQNSRAFYSKDYSHLVRFQCD